MERPSFNFGIAELFVGHCRAGCVTPLAYRHRPRLGSVSFAVSGPKRCLAAVKADVPRRFKGISACQQVETRMNNASKLIRDWSKTHGQKRLPNHWHLTRNRLSLKTNTYCHLIGKGWHTTVVLQWLVDFTAGRQNVDPVLKSALWSANHLLGRLEECKKNGVLILADPDIEQSLHLGAFYQRCYVRLHVRYKRFCPFLLFNLRPKFHLLTHFIESCQKKRNPLLSSTWTDETWIGQVMALASKCHKRTVQKTALQRYCAGQSYLAVKFPFFGYCFFGLLAGLKLELKAAVEALRLALRLISQVVGFSSAVITPWYLYCYKSITCLHVMVVHVIICICSGSCDAFFNMSWMVLLHVDHGGSHGLPFFMTWWFMLAHVSTCHGGSCHAWFQVHMSRHVLFILMFMFLRSSGGWCHVHKRVS